MTLDPWSPHQDVDAASPAVQTLSMSLWRKVDLSKETDGMMAHMM